MKNALTFDVEDWYQSTYNKNAQVRSIVIEQTSKVLGILSDAGIHATFFVQGVIAEAFPQIVKEIFKLGHEVGTHGYAHELVFEQTQSAFAEDLDKSIKLLEDLIGIKVIGYRAPDFSITERSLWALDILEQAGILYDSSIFPIKNKRYGIPDAERHFHYVDENLSPPFEKGGRGDFIRLIEFPLSTVRLLGKNLPVSGGGYFRLLPYKIIKSALKRINAEEMPVVVYMHPYEFDPYDISSIRGISKSLSDSLFRIMQNMNRKKSETKLRNLLKDFAFFPVAEVLNLDR
jgi:polysaccharide deacetylase family protein (PEP-CTERM system associated)